MTGDRTRWDAPSQWLGPRITYRRVLGAILVVLLLAEAGVLAIRAIDPGFRIADDIQASGSPLLQDASYRVGIWGRSGNVHVDLKPGATKEQAAAFWCAVVVPAAGDHLEDVQIIVWSSEPTRYGTYDVLADRLVACNP